MLDLLLDDEVLQFPLAFPAEKKVNPHPGQQGGGHTQTAEDER